jgi:cytochrome c oxidase subunit 1
MFLAAFPRSGRRFRDRLDELRTARVEQPLGQVFFNMGVQWAGASSIMTALNFLVTIITMRAPGMTFWRMPLLVWANFTTSLLVVIATPFIAGSQFFVMFDRVMHTNFFNVAEGGYVLGYQHIFWFYSHPAVYIMMLPGFGIISEVIAVMSRKPVFGYRLMALSLMAILVLGFSVWAHHMFVAGMAPWLRVPMMVTSMIIAVPTGIKIFSWLATMWEGSCTSGRRCCSRSASSRCSCSAASRGSSSRRCRSTSPRRTRTSSSRTSTTCSSAAPSSRSSPGSTTGSRR